MRMMIPQLAIFLFAVSGVLLAASLPVLRFKKYKLANGLNVILHEDHSTPIVAVNVWYHVGSKNEKPGRTGFAHLFEHMMFQGSKHHNKEFFDPLQKAGASVNGSTSEDRTNYWENVPSNYIELALWLEADRMGFLLPAMTQQKLDNQRDVVKNERRQGLENQPYAKAYDLLPALLYSRDHPYSWPVIGSMADLTAASMEDIQDFFRTYYAPNNASLCIAGDFNPQQAKELVEKYFAPIPPGPPVDRLEKWVPVLEGTRRAEMQDQVSLPRLFTAWHTPAHFEPGDAEFDLLANVLASGKTSRLYKALVYDKKIAQDVSAYQASTELSSIFQIEVTAREGQTLADLETALDSELQKILEKGITAEELTAAKNAYETQFVRSLQQIGGFGGRADTLNAYNVYLGDPGKLQWDLERYTKATADDVQKFARQYLDLERRAILHVVPQGKLAPGAEKIDRSKQPDAGSEPSFNPPAIQRTKLANGLELLLVEDRKLPLIQMNLVVKSGWASDPPQRPGAGSLAAELLDEGTESRSALQISEELKSIGANLTTISTFDSSGVLLNVLKKNLDRGLDLMSDIVLKPLFPKEELERQREIYLGRIRQEAKDPAVAARKSFLRTFYGPNHPYGQPYTGSGTETSIKQIQRDDLLAYYKSNYAPNNSAIAIAGDITLEEAKAKLEKAFQDWQPKEVKQANIDPPPALTKTSTFIIDKPNAAQSFIYLGGPGISRNDPDYVPISVLNRGFGGIFTSRINMNLREDKGYSYGVRSQFLETRGVGAFLVIAPVQTQSTREAIIELVKELKDVSGVRPLTKEEVADSKDYITKSFPQQFQTLSGIASLLSEIYLFDLPNDYWNQYLKEVRNVTEAVVAKVAREHLGSDALLIVVVGDRVKIEPALRQLNWGEISHLDPETF